MNCFEGEKRIEGDFYYDGGRYRVTAVIIKEGTALSSRTSRSIDLSPILSDIKWSASGKVTEQSEAHLKSANPGNGPWCKV